MSDGLQDIRTFSFANPSTITPSEQGTSESVKLSEGLAVRSGTTSCCSTASEDMFVDSDGADVLSKILRRRRFSGLSPLHSTDCSSVTIDCLQRH
jgi:hypothetical protein